MSSRRPSKLAALAIAIAGALIATAATPSAAWAGSPAPGPSVREVDDELVLIRVVPDDDGVAARLRAELGVIGLDTKVIDVASDSPVLGPDLFAHLESAGASAAIEIASSDGHVDVWVADGFTGKTLTRRFDVEQAEPRTLAIAAVELLRASRLEFHDEQGSAAVVETKHDPPDPPSEDAVPSVDLPPNPRPLRGALSLAPIIGGSPGGLGVSTHIEVAGRWVPLDRFALRLSAWVPTFGNAVSNDQGRARVFVGMAFVEPQLRLPGGAPWFRPELGLGIGGAVTAIVGEANDPTRSNTTVLGGFAGHAHLGLGFVILPRLWIRVDGYVGIVQPQPQVVFVDEVVARLGFPFGSGSLGIEIWL